MLPGEERTASLEGRWTEKKNNVDLGLYFLVAVSHCVNLDDLSRSHHLKEERV